ncbi:hydantoinase/carbamoylase family amidase [Cytobacillus suaedae]|nr:hydantoinase/carbamoylase family amidase [Cytobacillus suaedae]
MATLSINQSRLQERIEKLSEIGRTKDNGVERIALSEEDKVGHLLLSEWMREAGLSVRHDHFGNLIGRKEGTDPSLPVIMVGSHTDSVRNGGKFDGVIGVLAGIEIAQMITEAGISHQHPLEVVSFCEEEGSRFNDGIFGSRGMVGKVTQQDLQKVDDNHITRFEALQNFGFGINPLLIEESVRKQGEIKYFFEMHIEQGPLLESKNIPVGIVSGIAGPAWFKVKLTGEAGHAGTVPMNLRKDPLVGAAEIISEIERVCGSDPSVPTVGTVGRIQCLPGGTNIIPSTVEFTMDIRDIDLDRRNEAIKQVMKKIEEVCHNRGLQYDIEKNVDAAPVRCSEEIIQTFETVCSENGVDAPVMVSGAGHDAMFMADITEVGMIFVRSRDGISHHPEEWTDIEDITVGTKIMLEAVLKHL